MDPHGFPLQAQSACTSGHTDGTGCGTSEDLREPGLLATMASGSDVQIDLEYDTENGVEISGALPAGTDAVFVGFDTQLGTYRSFDLGGMSTTSNTSANQTRILNWLATVDPNDSRTPTKPSKPRRTGTTGAAMILTALHSELAGMKRTATAVMAVCPVGG